MIKNINNQLLYLFIINLLFIKNVISHSWITCTDYELPNNYPKDISNLSLNLTTPIIYDINKCSGFGRNYELQYNSDINRGFGFETNQIFRSKECPFSYNSQYYSSNIPMAQYKSGSQICLTYPSKNHIASECTSQWITDNGVTIHRSINKLNDDFSKEYQHLNGKHQKDTIDYKGFQNCPGFCNNPDKTVCYMCFNLEPNIDSGIYSFKWTWEFNPGEFYSSCWDAQIDNSLDNINNILETVKPIDQEIIPTPTPTPILISPEMPCDMNLRRLNTISYKYQKNLLCSQNLNILTEAPTINTPTVDTPNVDTPTITPSTSTKPKCNIKNNDNTNNNHNDNPNDNHNDNHNDNTNENHNETVNVWEQCGGQGIQNKKCNNSVCIKYSPYYSQCLPNELEKNELCGQDDNNEIKWKHKCRDNLKCIQLPNNMDYRCI